MKKFYLLLLLVMTTVTTMKADSSLMGDMNGDGAVDGTDVSILLEIVLNGGSGDVTTNSYTAKGVTFIMVGVPGGTFTMGATAEQGGDSYSDEFPTHEVTLSSYMIGQTEVTQALWKAVIGSNPSAFEGDNLPVERVSWDDCQEFISRLNRLTGKKFRLPTEAEWEYAARGGHSGGTKYSGSDDIDKVAWFSGNSDVMTHPVASKSPNAMLIYDMSGNVEEWCQDWKEDYSTEAQTDPQGPSSGSYRIFRGGRWNRDARGCRVSYREYNYPSTSSDGRGLRLAIDDDTSLMGDLNADGAVDGTDVSILLEIVLNGS